MMPWQIGEWDGVTAQKQLATPYANASQNVLWGGGRSFFLSAWRAYMDTWPASRLQNALAWNLKCSQLAYDATLNMMSQAGFKYLRQEFGVSNLQYANPNQLTSTALSVYDRIFKACAKYKVRPLILLNANSSQPCPMNSIVTQASAGNVNDTTITITGSLAGIRPGYTGLTNQTFEQTACPLITAINGSVCTLSQPLNKAFSAGNITLNDLLWHPFSHAAYSQSGGCTNASAIVTGLSWPPVQGATVTGTGIPANTTVLSVDSPTQIHLSNNFTGTTGTVTLTFSNPFSQETVNGWLTNYLPTISNFVASYVGPSGFDVELWNEFGFGSQFLGESNYYNPARTIATNMSYTSTQPGFTGLTWGGSGTGGSDNTYPLMLMVTDYFVENWPGVNVINGFANTVDGYCATTQFPPNMYGFSRHYYTDSGANLSPYNSARGSCFPDGSNNAPDYATNGPFSYDGSGRSPGIEGTFTGIGGWDGVVAGSFFVPVFALGNPESPFMSTKIVPLVQDVSAIPNNSGRYRGVTGPAGNTAQWWETETGFDITNFQAYLVSQGFSVTDPRMGSLLQFIQAKALLRYYCFYIHKGVERLYLFADYNGGLGSYNLQILSGPFWAALAANNYVLTPSIQALAGPQWQVAKNLSDFVSLSNGQPSFTVTPLTVNSVIEYFPRLAVLGDGTAANPTLTHVDEYGIFPFQMTGESYAIGHYVVTRNMVHAYNQGTDNLDPLRYTMPDQYFDISFSVSNSGLRLDRIPNIASYDPLTGQWIREDIVYKDNQNLTVRVKSSDYPRFLYVGAPRPQGMPPEIRGGSAKRSPRP